MVTQARLRELLHYEPKTGVFTRLKQTSNRIKVGGVAGTFSGKYRQVRVDARLYKEHRLAWLYVFGYLPALEIDHINGHPGDNRIANLREVPRAVNAENQRIARSHNTCGVLGVRRSHKKWTARITVRGTTHYLGIFASSAEAYVAYIAAKRRLHEGNTL